MNFGCQADVFNYPTIGNTCSLAATPFGHSVHVQAGQNAEVLNWLVKGFAGQKAVMVFIERPHKKSVKKIWMTGVKK